MISYLQGKIQRIYDDRIILLVNGIGYEVLIPAYLLEEIRRTTKHDDALSLYISYNQTERQPKPILVGFKNELEKDFFELFISVEDIGPQAAIRAITIPIREIARYIEEKDIKGLRQLKGIGERKAEKIVATLKGRVAKYALLPEKEEIVRTIRDFRKEVEDVLVNQLGHKIHEARQMIVDALERNPKISSSEELFEEVYRGQKK
ncbi:MAG TPA: OB-fold domain-containing protein [Syntrophorhabdaceae bacterium]|nr:OB-fold domain-containing protein [Syntrophorhabdaceae bacterium]HPU29798.1 OB-fold domain-containing protein [Syntrophorhabdaceae bacterium]